MTRTALEIDSGTGARRVELADYLDAGREEQAVIAAYDWIKGLRHLQVEGQTLRRRFTLRGDSLWWFAELYLHKQQVILRMFRTLSALEHLVERERPLAIRVLSSERIVRGLARQFAGVRAIKFLGEARLGSPRLRLARMDARARALMLGARLSRLRSRSPRPDTAASLAAFVHRAFWRAGVDEGSAESYIGPVLESLERRTGVDVRYVGVGPAANFQARRWWHPLRGANPASSVVPVETFAPLTALRDAQRIWRERHVMRRALWASPDLRRHAVVNGTDCWPIVSEELAGIALLQWPWSARAMDEAGAALDALRPRAALTYAEAGGWGRALMLECRRRGIPSIGLQHGFIYRHWLNYLHEPDEMVPDEGNPRDAGFPHPTLTLLFDDYASRHLEEHGRFPRTALAVTGSPRLDALVAAAAEVDAAAIAQARDAAGATGTRALVLVVTKYREARDILPALADAAAAMPDVQVAIKTHPAETADVYAPLAAGRPNIRVLGPAVPLAPLLRASRAVVTVNSTVALDAAVLGVPALVIGLPNNLSPFVDARIMAGAASAAEIAPALAQILYDEGLRLQLERERSAYLRRYRIGSDRRAADRSVDAVLQLIHERLSLSRG